MKYADFVFCEIGSFEKSKKRPNRNGVRLSLKYIRKARCCYRNYPRLRLRPSKKLLENSFK